MHEEQRASGDKAAALLDQAAQAYRSTLEVFTKAGAPQGWAYGECTSESLVDEGFRSSADKAPALLDQAVEAYRNALQVYTKTDEPLTGRGSKTRSAIASD